MKARAASMLLLFLTLSLPAMFSQEGFNHRSLVLTVYADGAVHVTETLVVEPSQPSIDVPLLGQTVENLLVTDENGTLLDSIANGTILLVDTLGANRAVLEYDCLDLTSKLGALWTLSVHSPVNFTLVFPANTTIVELSQVPLEIKSLEERPALVLGPGIQEVSYVIGLFGPEAEAADAILRAETAIRTARADGRTDGLAEAEAVLTRGRESYQARRYAEATALATEAQTAAERATAPFPILTALGMAVAFATLSMSLALYMRGRHRPAETKFDLERLFREKPWLNPDQRRVIEFLADSKGSAFEAEIREAVNQPKSTVWRIIKKLEDEGIVAVEQLRGQNYVTLRRRAEDSGARGKDGAKAT